MSIASLKLFFFQKKKKKVVMDYRQHLFIPDRKSSLKMSYNEIGLFRILTL